MKKFFTIIFSIQLMVLGLVGLDHIKLGIPLLRSLIGFIYIFSQVFKQNFEKNQFKFLSIFLVIFLLFNCNWVSEILNDNPKSISLSKENILGSNNIENIKYFYTGGGYTETQSVFGAEWLSKNRDKQYRVYSDDLHRMHVLTSYGEVFNPSIYELASNLKTYPESYIYLADLNTRYGIMYSSAKKYWNINEDSIQGNLIYSNKDCKIYSN